jgi:hypothetical protein
LPPRRPNPGASPASAYVTRAAADLPLFHGVSRKKLLAWRAQRRKCAVRSAGGILSTLIITNRQSMTGIGRSSMSIGELSTGLIRKEEGAWRQSGLDRKALAMAIRFFYSRITRNKNPIQAMC